MTRNSSKGPRKGTEYSMTNKGSYFADPARKSDEYNAESRKRPTRYTRNFDRVMNHAEMKSVDDLNFFTYLEQYIKVDTVAAGDGKTAFENVLSVYITRMYTRANDKDVVAANLTAFKEVCCDCLQIMFEVMAQNVLRVGSITESNTTSGAISVLGIFKQDDWDFTINNLAKFGPVPKFLYKIAEAMMFNVRVIISKSYNRWAEIVPPSYFAFWRHIYDLEELQAVRDKLKTNAIKAKTYMDKYGVPYDNGFDVKRLLTVRTLSKKDPDVRAMFSHRYVVFRYQDAAQAVLYPCDSTGQVIADLKTNQTTAYTGRRFWFRGTTSESPVDAIIPLLGEYNAANNEYGITAFFTTATPGDGNAGLGVFAEDDTAPTQYVVGTHAMEIWMRFLGTHGKIDGNSYRHCIVGDLGGVVFYLDMYAAQWPYTTEEDDLKYGDSLTYNEIRNNLFSFLMDMKVPTSKGLKGPNGTKPPAGDIIED